MKKTDKFIDRDDLSDITVDNICSLELNKLIKKNNKTMSKKKTVSVQSAINSVNENINDFEQSIDTIKTVLGIYYDEYNDSLNAINEFNEKIKHADGNSKIEELHLVKEYYNAKLFIVEHEIKLKNKRIELIEQMIKFLKLKLKNIHLSTM